MTKERQARTRTLIQLGGVVERSGLVKALGLTLGSDLQKDPLMFNGVAMLMALLYDQATVVYDASPDEFAQWIRKGRSLLQNETLE